MKTYLNLIQQFRDNPGDSAGREFVHATLAGFASRIHALEKAVNSLVPQVDTLHIFLDQFERIPEFMKHEKIYLTRSQDFGDLGECGKYYWTDDLAGYHFICSDELIYPPDYVATMILKIEQLHRTSVVGAGGYLLQQPFTCFEDAAFYLQETDLIPMDTTVPVISDRAAAYHSTTLRVSRHFFYQPELSSIWLSIVGLEQQVPLTCLNHPADWLSRSGVPAAGQSSVRNGADYRSFLIRAHFLPPGPGESPGRGSHLNNCFDRIYVMNLDRRPDRWKKIRQIATKHHIHVTRFPAVDGSKDPVKRSWQTYFISPLRVLPEGIEPLTDYKDKFLKYHHYIARVHFMESKLGRKALQSPGAWGYALTYIRILQDAILHDHQRILIMDDDIILHKSFDSEFAKHYGNLPGDWKIFMLGAMQHYWEPWITRTSEVLYQCHGSSVASHAVGITKKAFLPLLFYSEKLDLPVDEGAVFHVQQVYDGQCFISFPNLIIQDMCESDISSSAMKQQDEDRWMKLFRWNREDYDYPADSTKTEQLFQRLRMYFKRLTMRPGRENGSGKSQGK